MPQKTVTAPSSAIPFFSSSAPMPGVQGTSNTATGSAPFTVPPLFSSSLPLPEVQGANNVGNLPSSFADAPPANSANRNVSRSTPIARIVKPKTTPGADAGLHPTFQNRDPSAVSPKVRSTTLEEGLHAASPLPKKSRPSTAKTTPAPESPLHKAEEPVHTCERNFEAEITMEPNRGHGHCRIWNGVHFCEPTPVTPTGCAYLCIW